MDALVALAALAVLIAPFFLLGLTRWAGMFGSIALVGGAFEGAAYLKTGKTLSQKFWAFRKNHPKAAWGVILLLAAGWTGLLLHLIWR